MKRTSVLLLTVCVGACVWGRPDRDEIVRADTPYGKRVALSVDEVPGGGIYSSVIGEALYREPEAIVVLTDRSVIRVHMSRILAYTIYPVGNRERPVDDVPATSHPFRNATRYPEPLTPSQLETLLEAEGVQFYELGPKEDAGARQSPSPDATGHGHGAAGAADDGRLVAFLDEARANTDRFADLDVAIAEGYRRLGPSFPGMGEHWIHPGRIVSGRIEAARPQVLCYVRIDGEPRLVSLAYAVPLGPDEMPPDEPFSRDAWHDHDDTVDEETLLLAHPASHHGGEGPRLSMVHVWLWPENPDGPIAQNNWRLPFAEAGLPFDDLDPGPDAARGLSLHTAPPEYYELLLGAAAELSEAEREALVSTLRDHRAMARSWVDGRPPDESIGLADLAALAEIWASLWSTIEGEIEPSTWSRVAVLR